MFGLLTVAVSCGQQKLICSQVCYLHTPLSPLSPLSPGLTLQLYERLRGGELDISPHKTEGAHPQPGWLCRSHWTLARLPVISPVLPEFNLSRNCNDWWGESRCVSPLMICTVTRLILGNYLWALCHLSARYFVSTAYRPGAPARRPVLYVWVTQV